VWFRPHSAFGYGNTQEDRASLFVREFDTVANVWLPPQRHTKVINPS
jgi:hypothetical protein